VSLPLLGWKSPPGCVFATGGPLAVAFADGSPDSPGFACTETMALATEMIGFD
jgi:hypothetical protein